jgi:hypothetical protein
MSDEVEMPNEVLERHEQALEHGHAAGPRAKDPHAARMTLVIILLAMSAAIAGKVSSSAEIRYLRHHIERSDAWAEYQAKSTRQSMYEAMAEMASVLPNASTPEVAKTVDDFKARAAHMASSEADGSGKKQLAERAKHEEELRDQAGSRLEDFELVVSVIAIAIGLGSASLLTPAGRPRLVLGAMSMAAGASAALYGIYAFVFG